MSKADTPLHIPVWDVGHKKISFPILKKSIETDICIIGAGISGLSLAYRLSKAGKKVVILDKGEIGFGETGVTTAHLSNVLDDRYFQLLKYHGVARTKLVLESHSGAIDFIEKIVKKERIDCDFARVNGYLSLGPNDKLATLNRELKTLRQLGLKSIKKQKKGPKAPIWELV